MNILPKKRWHVRTKDNIARVRRDEAEAAEKEKERICRAKLAEKEARTAFLRNKVHSQESLGSAHVKQLKSADINPISKEQPEPEGNINFFKDAELGKQTSGTNKEYEAEKKAEQEKYEQSIGYLTYLGQNSCEASGTKAWYEHKSGIVASCESDAVSTSEEVGLKSKMKLDPINEIVKYAGLKPLKKTNAVIANKEEISNSNCNNEKEKLQEISCRDDKEKKKEKKNKRERKHKKYKKGHKKKRKKGIEGGGDHLRNKKCKHKKNKIDRHRKRKSSSDDKRRHHHKRRRYNDSYNDSNSTSERSSFSSSESTDKDDDHQEKQKKLEVLRAERLKREAEERRRAERLLAGQKVDKVEEETANGANFKQKYNSQFNPHLARQNLESKMLETDVKYWLQ